MIDIIQLLPDAVANQIAAGEVVQRPASAVKELMENAIDAGATSVKLIVKDAGKTLIQVMDNGCGMSETDARMCFERHATSKIRKAEDLFAIRTMGFRGEAMASIAAIAQLEMKTRRTGDDLGVIIQIEGSEVKSQEPLQCSTGTSIAIKNLFYNVPARRNFLKSNAAELRHIIEEFQRVALSHPEVAFIFHNNDTEVFHLEKGSFRQRIMGIFGSSFNQKLVPVEEETNIVKISGFIGKPEFAKKSRGEQFFFVNKRFIKNNYLNHAIQAACSDFLQADAFPSYFLMLDIPPAAIDINIHPTKTEIKFEDEKSIYSIIRSAVKQSLSKYHIAPSLDFDQETSFNLPYSFKNKDVVAPGIVVNTSYNPFKKEDPTGFKKPTALENINKENWEKLYKNKEEDKPFSELLPQDTLAVQQTINPDWSTSTQTSNKINYQLHNTYILASIKSGLIIIDQNGAHERILFERYLESLEKQTGISQQQLFPQTIEFSTSDFDLVKELLPEIKALGFDINEFGKNTFVINGAPSDVKESETKDLMEGLIEQYKKNLSELKLNKTENLARSIAKKLAVKPGKSLNNQEINNLVDELFGCKMPYISPAGKPSIITLTLEDLAKKFLK